MLRAMASCVLVLLCIVGASVGALACQEGEKKLVRWTGCSMYLECKSGENIMKSCNPDEVFDVPTNSCRSRREAVCHEDPTRCDTSAAYPHPRSCRLYYQCDGSRLVTKLCPIGQLYDPKIKACRFGASCQEEGCQEGMRRPIEGESSQYETCEQGKWIRKVCHGNSNFEQGSLSCENEGSDCVQGQTISLNCNQYLSCNDGSWVLSNCALGEVFDRGQCKTGVCKARAKRNVKSCVEGRKRRVEGSCKKYTECVDGNEVEKTCSECMNFNDASSSCQYVFNSPCPNPAPPVPTDPPTTPQPPTPAPSSPKPPTPAPSSPKPPTAEPSSPKPPTPAPSSPKPPTAEPSSPKPPTPAPSSPIPPTAAPSSPKPPTAEPSSPKPPTAEPKTPTAAPEPSSPEPKNRPTIAPNPPPQPHPDDPTPKCKDGDRKVIPGECKNYLECVYGKYYTNRCNYFQHFDKVTMDCRVFGYTCP